MVLPWLMLYLNKAYYFVARYKNKQKPITSCWGKEKKGKVKDLIMW